MSEKITIEQFVKEYFERKSTQLQEKYIKEKLEIKQYLPYNLKVGFARNIVNCSSFDKNKNLKLSSTLRYLFYIRTVITEYTNLTENKKNSSFLDEYDALASTGLLEVIISKIPEKEINEFKTVVDMVLDDTITQFTSPQIFVSDQIQRVMTIISKISEPLIASAVKSFESIDGKDAENIVKKLSGFIKKNNK